MIDPNTRTDYNKMKKLIQLDKLDGNRKGVFTRDRRPKLAAHFLRKRWADIPNFGYKNPETAAD